MPVSVCRAPAALFQVESIPTDTWSAPTSKDEEQADQSSIWTSTTTPSPLSTFQANMHVSVCRAPPALFQVESIPTDTWSAPTRKDEEHADQSSIWTMIQSQKSLTPNAADTYVHPLVRRSSSLMSKSSLEMCTESLGSETGSGDFSDDDWLNSFSEDKEVVVKQKARQQQLGDGKDLNQLMSVSYHGPVSRRSPAPRSFPPPLSSIPRHDCNCIQMRTHRQDGRLVVDAVPIASQNFLHARRMDGRLFLSFIDSAAISQPATDRATQELPLNKEDKNGRTYPATTQTN